MKKFFFIAALFTICALVTNAQTQQSFLAPLQSDLGIHAAGVDTTVNGTGIAQQIRIPGFYDQLTFQAGVLKLTGTPGGSVKLLGSVDGVKYDFATTATDTLAVTSSSILQVKTWKISPSTFQYYKAVYTPTGTQSSTISTSVLARRK